jgi:hypothetical protein
MAWLASTLRRWLGLRSPSREFMQAAGVTPEDLARAMAEAGERARQREAALGRPMTPEERIALALADIEPHLPALRRASRWLRRGLE